MNYNHKSECAEEESSCVKKDIAEIESVLSTMGMEIASLEDEVSNLSQRIKPVLMSELPNDCSKDRCKRESDLGEAIQQKTDKISNLKEFIKDLSKRVAL